MVYITTNTHVCLDQSIDLCVLQDACHELFGVWGDFYLSRTQHAEVIKSLHHGYLGSEARYGDGDISITELNKIVHSHVLQSSRWLTHCIVVCDLYLRTVRLMVRKFRRKSKTLFVKPSLHFHSLQIQIPRKSSIQIW